MEKDYFVQDKGQGGTGYVFPSLAKLKVEEVTKDMRQYKELERLTVAVESELKHSDYKNELAMKNRERLGADALGVYPCVNGREIARDGNRSFQVNVEGGRELNVGEIQVREKDGNSLMVADIDGVLTAKEISSKCYEDFLRGDKNQRMELFASTFEDVKIGEPNRQGSYGKLISMGYDNAFDYPCEVAAKKQFVEGHIEGYTPEKFKDYLLSKGIDVDLERGVVSISTGYDQDGNPIEGKQDTIVKIDKNIARAIMNGNFTGDSLDIENRMALLKNVVYGVNKSEDVKVYLEKISFKDAVEHSSLSVKGELRDIEARDGEKEFLLHGKSREINPQLLDAISKAGALRERETGRAVNIQSLKLVKAGVDKQGQPVYMLKGLVDGKELNIQLTKEQAIDLMKYDDMKRIELLKNYSPDYFLDEPVYRDLEKKPTLADYIDRIVAEKPQLDVEHLESGKTKVSISFNGNVASQELSAKQSEKMLAMNNEGRGRMIAKMFADSGIDLKAMSFEEMGRMYMDKYIGKESVSMGNTTAPDKYVSNIGISSVKATSALAMAAAAYSQTMGEDQSVGQQQSAGMGR